MNIKTFFYVLFIFLCNQVLLPVFAQEEPAEPVCSVDPNSGMCIDGAECKLQDEEVGVCRQSGDNCVCESIS
ncbi:MAG: hypothetical protein A3B68_08230 [Candidatus Melainabacteria bacterium RIFCSPHIGHO2_02_FULL_34_12]|nr:MAG: hypothetical protein A3B68_08230 [Candidatus Melainabacteria bacterium RIFCSPHIGHO2_02_FULL_34_12]